MSGAAKILTASLFALLLTILLSCAEGSLPPSAPPAPTPSDPWFGTAGNVLISDRGLDSDGILDQIWIGFNSASNWQDFLALHQQHPNGGWIGGVVVVEPRNPLGFYFDPNTVKAAEITAEMIQTSLDAIKKNPAHFANARWVVVPVTEQNPRQE